MPVFRVYCGPIYEMGLPLCGVAKRMRGRNRYRSRGSSRTGSKSWRRKIFESATPERRADDMIKVLGKKPDGTRLVIVGITNNNVRRMKKGQPLHVDLAELGIEKLEMGLHLRPTMKELEADFAPYIGINTKIHIDPKTITNPEPEVSDEPEGQETIANWVRETFGEPQKERAIMRAHEEMQELVECLDKEVTPDEVGEEMADVAICLFAAAEAWGQDLAEHVDRKMAKNRKRKWRSMGDGTGYHIKET